VNDCSDKSDELLPQCNSIPAKIDSPNGDSVGVGIPIAIGFIVVLCMGLVGVVGYFILRRNNSTADNESNNPLSPSLDIPPNGTLQRVPAPVPEKKIMRTAPNGMTMVNNNSTLDDVDIVSGGGVMSTVLGPSGAIGGSSNGIAYDRSHVTGASSSTTSSSNFPRDFSNPPPSPATVVANSVTQRQQPPRQHQSMHSLPRSRHHRGGRMAANRQYNGRSSHHIHHPPPPPTPYSTDFNEESDYGVGPSGPNYPSAANSTHGGYESSDAYAEHLGFNNPPPLTPHYYSDYVNENSCPPSPTPEENTFFLTQPPPSPVPSVSPLDDDEENDCR
jgi:low density lipoprotein receptor-related protein 5/6